MHSSLDNVSFFEIYIGESFVLKTNTLTCAKCGDKTGPGELTLVATWEYKVCKDGVERRKFILNEPLNLPCGHQSHEVWMSDEKLGG